MKEIVHDPETQCDIFGALRFYEARRPGLGTRFIKAVDKTIVRIAAGPQLFPYYEKPIRSCRVSGFPYRVLFTDEPECILLSPSHIWRGNPVGGDIVSSISNT